MNGDEDEDESEGEHQIRRVDEWWVDGAGHVLNVTRVMTYVPWERVDDTTIKGMVVRCPEACRDSHTGRYAQACCHHDYEYGEIFGWTRVSTR